MTRVDRWSTLWSRRRINSVPSIPLARNSTDSSVDRPAKSQQTHPQIPPTRQKCRQECRMLSTSAILNCCHALHLMLNYTQRNAPKPILRERRENEWRVYL